MFRSVKPARLGAGAILLLVLALPGCNANKLGRSEGVPEEITAEEVSAAIERAEAAMARKEPRVALDWMRAASQLKYLPPEQRGAVQRLLESSAERTIEELGGPDDDPEVLADILELDLPRQIAVTGAIRAAEMMNERGDYEDAYDLIKKIDRLFPMHHLRAEAGRLLTEAGLALSYDESGWFLDDPQDAAMGALEYCSIHYPTSSEGDKVLRRLAEMYEEDKSWELAIARHEELVQGFPESRLVPYSLARIPHLLLAGIESPEFDRNALIEAREGLERWLRDYPDLEIADQVRHDLDDSLIRLCISDLSIADFYWTIDDHVGTFLHAERALEEALSAGDEARAEAARKLMENSRPAEEAP